MASQAETIPQVKVKLVTKFSDLLNKATRRLRLERLQSIKRIPKLSRRKWVYVLIGVLVLALGIWFFAFRSPANNHDISQATYVAKGPQAQLNKRFDVPIRNSEGKEVGAALAVNVTFLERTEELIYQGKPLVARSGKDFLVVNLEVENSTNNRLTIRPVDFFRLISQSGKSYAADIQTEPVKVEPQSSKKTRTIFIIDDDQKLIKLIIGEIKGENKETVEVSI